MPKPELKLDDMPAPSSEPLPEASPEQADAPVERKRFKLTILPPEKDQPFPDGFIANVDVPGEIIQTEDGPVFEPSDPEYEHPEGVPWYFITCFQDLDRLLFARASKAVLLDLRIKQLQAEKKKVEGSIEQTANYYGEFIPAPDPDGKTKSKRTVGPFTGIGYTNMPERPGEYKLVSAEKELAIKAGTVRQVWEEQTATFLREYAEKHGTVPPGYKYVHANPISVSLDALKKRAGVEDAGSEE